MQIQKIKWIIGVDKKGRIWRIGIGMKERRPRKGTAEHMME
jgi:hypothetical protein